MKNKVEIDGKWYELVPMKEERTRDITNTFYYGCDSECGVFQFTVLMDEGGNVWEGTESITYYPKGLNNKENCEYWDNSNFLNAILDNPSSSDVVGVKCQIEINLGEFENLTYLLQQVRDKGWLKCYQLDERYLC